MATFDNCDQSPITACAQACLQFSPQKIAAAAIYIAAAYLEIEVSAASAMRWDDLLGLSAYQLENISRADPQDLFCTRKTRQQQHEGSQASLLLTRRVHSIDIDMR